MRRTVISFAALLTATLVRTATAAELEFDHVWIVVTRDAPERAALERAGLKISPDVNRHDGQGTASISAEFLNAYLELIWPDPTVSVAPGAERGVEKFKNRMNWRASGWCPIGIGLHRSGPATPLPFPTWTIAPDWMPKGTAIEILTARDDTRSPSFFIEPPVLAVKDEANRKIDSASPASDHSMPRVPAHSMPVSAIRFPQLLELAPNSELVLFVTDLFHPLNHLTV